MLNLRRVLPATVIEKTRSACEGNRVQAHCGKKAIEANPLRNRTRRMASQLSRNTDCVAEAPLRQSGIAKHQLGAILRLRSKFRPVARRRRLRLVSRNQRHVPHDSLLIVTHRIRFRLREVVSIVIATVAPIASA